MLVCYYSHLQYVCLFQEEKDPEELYFFHRGLWIQSERLARYLPAGHLIATMPVPQSLKKEHQKFLNKVYTIKQEKNTTIITGHNPEYDSDEEWEKQLNKRQTYV